MRNLIVLNDIKVKDISTREDAISLTSNPFSKELFVLYRCGIVIGIKEETQEVIVGRFP